MIMFIDVQVSGLIDLDVSRKAFRKNWARLIQKIYNVNPLVCPRCHGQMRVISFIEQPEIIEKILKHLNLWETRNLDSPTRKAAHIPELIIDPSYSQLPETEYWLQSAPLNDLRLPATRRHCQSFSICSSALILYTQPLVAISCLQKSKFLSIDIDYA
jgi:hypothetical protein